MAVQAHCTSDSPLKNAVKQHRISSFKYIYIIIYLVTFTSIAIIFFGAYIPGYRYHSYDEPRIVILWSLLLFRFLLDLTVIVIFLKKLVFFINMKVDKLADKGKSLTLFHVLVSICKH